MVSEKRKLRNLRATVLIVAEGYAEEQFLRHVRSLYTCDRQGVRLEIRNARGKGAGHVIEHAIRLRANADFGHVAALFDVDTDWNTAIQKRARRNGILTLTSEPCLEGLLLEIAGNRVNAATGQLKGAFEKKFGGPPDREGLIARYFSKEILEEARGRIPVLQALLKLLTDGP
jgi:hypothetical protein